jgi:uncharacterized protein with PIN domain
MLNDVNELLRIVLGEPDKPFNYHDYLKSEQWEIKRQEKFKQVGKRCQVCNGSYRLQIHHRTYDRIGKEKLDDLTVLCSTCHKLFHDNGRLKKYRKVKNVKRKH